MIYQFFYDKLQYPYLFESELYRPVGLEPDVKPTITHHCPELAKGINRAVLCEYGGMLHLWRNGYGDAASPDHPHHWIGFTSFRQLSKNVHRIFWPRDREWIEELLFGPSPDVDVIAWADLLFSDRTLAEDAEKVWPGFNGLVEEAMFQVHGYGLPDAWHQLRGGPFANYFICRKPFFGDYMQWSWPIVHHFLWRMESGEKWLMETKPFPFIGQMQERLFIMFCIRYAACVFNANQEPYSRSHWRITDDL